MSEIDLILDDVATSTGEMRNTDDEESSFNESTGIIMKAEGESINLESESKDSNYVIVKIDDIDDNLQEFSSDYDSVQERVRCSLCMRYNYVGPLTDGHLYKGSYSQNPLSKILSMTVQKTIRLSKQNWHICSTCVDMLEDADETLHDLIKIQQKLCGLKRGFNDLLNLNLGSTMSGEDDEIINEIAEATHEVRYKRKLNQDNVRVTKRFMSDISNLKQDKNESKESMLTRSMSHTEGKERISCPLCHKVVTKQSLRSHIPVLHKKHVPITCKQCVKTFPNEARFAEHAVTYHELMMAEDLAEIEELEVGVTKRKYEKQRIPCNICGLLVTSQYIRNHTKNAHNTEYFFKCTFCGDQFTRMLDRILHVRKVHGYEKPVKKSMPCEFCGRTFRGNGLLQYHIRTSHLHPKRICQVCGREFKKKTALVVHMRVHTGELPFMCKICNKRFRHSHGCRKHLKKVHKLELSWSKNIPFGRSNIPMIRVPSDHDDVIIKADDTLIKNELEDGTEKYEVVVTVPDENDSHGVESTVEVYTVELNA